jgi:hypothetical protein
MCYLLEMGCLLDAELEVFMANGGMKQGISRSSWRGMGKRKGRVFS